MAHLALPTVTRTRLVTIPADASLAFPLFEPIGEKAWADGWEPEILLPAPEAPSGAGLEEMVFRTRGPAEPPTTWVVALHDPSSLTIEYATVTPGHRVGRIRVEIEAAGHDRSRARVTYGFSALSTRGVAFVRGFTEERFAARMERWERAIGHYLATGRILPGHGD
jgi:hypothetical protein